MSADNLEKSLDFVLKWEGADGAVTTDTGGVTRWGISSKSYPTLDIANLSLAQAKLIYHQDYWEDCNCDNIPWPYDIVVMDTAVNCGVGQALLWHANADNWQDFLLRRVLHYTKLAKSTKYRDYYRGWMNRVMNLYEVAS